MICLLGRANDETAFIGTLTLSEQDVDEAVLSWSDDTKRPLIFETYLKHKEHLRNAA